VSTSSRAEDEEEKERTSLIPVLNSFQSSSSRTRNPSNMLGSRLLSVHFRTLSAWYVAQAESEYEERRNSSRSACFCEEEGSTEGGEGEGERDRDCEEERGPTVTNESAIPRAVSCVSTRCLTRSSRSFGGGREGIESGREAAASSTLGEG
jgi:hypothetical protein